jgi:hypothetical protein
VKISRVVVSFVSQFGNSEFYAEGVTENSVNQVSPQCACCFNEVCENKIDIELESEEGFMGTAGSNIKHYSKKFVSEDINCSNLDFISNLRTLRDSGIDENVLTVRCGYQ